MPYTVPHTIVPGETVTVATMNNEWGGNVAFLANPPACRVYNSVGPLSHTSSGSWQDVSSFPQERFDTDGMHSTSVATGRITMNKAGLYMVGGCLEFAGSATGMRGLKVVINNASDIVASYWPNNGVIGVSLSVATVYKFAANDYITLASFQNSGGNLSITTPQSNAAPEFWAVWVGLG